MGPVAPERRGPIGASCRHLPLVAFNPPGSPKGGPSEPPHCGDESDPCAVAGAVSPPSDDGSPALSGARGPRLPGPCRAPRACNWVGVFGGALGVVAAVLMITQNPFSLSAEAVTIAFVASWQLSLQAILFSVIGAIAAGLLPARFAANHPTISALQDA